MFCRMILAAFMILPAATPHEGTRPEYGVVELTGASEGNQTCRGINNLGVVVGRSGSTFIATETRAVIWYPDDRKLSRIDTLVPNQYSSADAINDSGEVAGNLNTDTSVIPFVWSAKTGFATLPLPRGDNGGQVFGINKNGHVAGYSSGRGGARAFVWAERNAYDIGVLPGGRDSTAMDINDSGLVTGSSSSSAGKRAFIWSKTEGLVSLGTLPGDTSSEALAINNKGAVAGYSDGPRGMRAFVWTRATGMVDLGVLPGGQSSQAFDINDSGVVVGISATLNEGDRAFVWTPAGGMKDLNVIVAEHPAAVFVEAQSINNKGQIIVMAAAAEEDDHHGGEEAEPGVHGHTSPKGHHGPQRIFVLSPLPGCSECRCGCLGAQAGTVHCGSRTTIGCPLRGVPASR